MLSNPLEVYNYILEKIVKNNKERRPLIDDVLKSVYNANDPFFFIVNAPTGYGKTMISFSLALASIADSSLFDKVIHVLPLRSLVEDIYHRAQGIFNGYVGRKMMGVSETVFYFLPLNVVTIDTFIFDTIKLNTKKLHRIRRAKEFGYDYLTQASILNSLVIFDEAHFLSESKLIRKTFFTVLEFLLRSEIPIILMTATMPTKILTRYKKIAKIHGYACKRFKVFIPNNQDPYIQKQKTKKFDLKKREISGLNELVTLIEPDRRTLIIFNTVADAYRFYEFTRSKIKIPKKKIILLHGRMTAKTKTEKLMRIRSLQNENFIVITTQIIEAGVDLSSDVLITEISPPNSLIQRMGRVARYDETVANIFVIKQINKNYHWPYEPKEIKFAWNLLPDSLNPRIPSNYREYIDSFFEKVYGNFIAPIDSKLLRIIDDPFKRSRDVLNYLLSKFQQDEAFIREFSIPIEINGDTILVHPSFAYKLYQKGFVLAFKNNNPLKLESIKDFYELAKNFALGKPVHVKFIGKYDDDIGVV